MRTLALLNVGLATTLVLGQAPDSAEPVLREIQKLGGTIYRDASRPGKPVVAVELTGLPVSDDLLRNLHRLKHLENLDL